MIGFQSIAASGGVEPFRPFRITMTSGRTFEVRHPERIQVGRTTRTIFSFLSNDPEEAKESQAEVSLLLAESIEPLDTAVRPQGA